MQIFGLFRYGSSLSAELEKSRAAAGKVSGSFFSCILPPFDGCCVLGSQRCRNVKIGTQLARGISGGQAKRVNIGIALVTNPRVLFLDEPTSGLDSYTANEVRDSCRLLMALIWVWQALKCCSCAAIAAPPVFESPCRRGSHVKIRRL